jgi:hypothetical protein
MVTAVVDAVVPGTSYQIRYAVAAREERRVLGAAKGLNTAVPELTGRHQVFQIHDRLQ